MYHKDNFYIGTKATFKGCKVPHRKPDYISYFTYEGKDYPSSRYWYTKEGVIRFSDHWSLYRYLNDGIKRTTILKKAKKLINSYGYYAYQADVARGLKLKVSSNHEVKGCLNIASCFWILKTNNKALDNFILHYKKPHLAGFCKWDNFKKYRS